jgi:hypothetical protein
VVYVITELVLGTVAATLLTIVTALWTSWLWFVLPLMRLAEGRRHQRHRSPPAP